MFKHREQRERESSGVIPGRLHANKNYTETLHLTTWKVMENNTAKVRQLTHDYNNWE